METNTLLLLILAVFSCGFAIVSYRLTVVTRTLALATGAAADVLHHDVGTLGIKATDLLSEIETLIRSLTKDIQSALVVTNNIATDGEAVSIAAKNKLQPAGYGMPAISVSMHDLIELLKTIKRDVADLAAIPEDLRSMKATLEIIADNTEVGGP